MKHLAIFINVIILLSCGSSQDVANTEEMMTNETISGSYTLEELANTNITEEQLTLKFDSNANKVFGFAGCNRFFATYSTSGNTISFSEMGATKMMCEDEANKIERKMFQTITKINSFELSNGALRLKEDETVLIKANENMTSEFRQGETKINLTYRASTRGFFETIWIEGNVLKYTNDRDLKEISRHQMSDEQLSELLALYNDLDLKSIPSLKPPSKTFQYDAAAMARLTIVKNENSYVSNGFDHGNPPKSIALFIDKVLSIKETMAKQ